MPLQNPSQSTFCLREQTFLTYVLLVAAFISSFRSPPASADAGKDCVVCLMAQSGETELRKLGTAYADMSEILQHFEGGEEKINSLRLTLESAQSQSATLMRLCDRDKGKLTNKFKMNDQIPTCKAYLDTAGIEVTLKRRYVETALPYVQTRLADAREQERALVNRLLRQPGVSSATLNSHPQLKAYKQILQKLQSEFESLMRDRRRLNESVPDRPWTSEAVVDSALQRLKRSYGIDSEKLLLHCWAIHESETAREVGCKIAK